MVSICISLLSVFTIIYSVLIPVYQSMQESKDRNYEEKLRVFKALWIKKYYIEARDISIADIYRDIDRLEPWYDAIGNAHKS